MIGGRLVAVAAALVLLASWSAVAADEVVVRAAAHSKERFGRITFTWPAPVRYQARLDGTTLTIHFARPMTARLDAIPKHLAAYVSFVQLRPDNATVVARVARGATLRSFASGNTVAVDIALKRGRRAAAEDAPDAAEIVAPPEFIEPAAGGPADEAGPAMTKEGLARFVITAQLPGDRTPGRRRGDDGANPSADTSCGRRDRA